MINCTFGNDCSFSRQLVAKLAGGGASLGRSTEFGSNVAKAYESVQSHTGSVRIRQTNARQTHAGQVNPPSYRRLKRVILQHYIGAAIVLETREEKI